jgi:hypothetical protein
MRKSTGAVGSASIPIGFFFLGLFRDFPALGLRLIVFGILPFLVVTFAVETVCAECKQKTWIVSLNPDLNKPHYCQACERKRPSPRALKKLAQQAS